jgi:hypothetical protein
LTTMRTHIEFRSSKFPAREGEDQLINPGRFGRSLAEYLKTRLLDQGIETGELVAEDWGWVVPVKNEAFPLWVGCVNYEKYPDGFLCFIEPKKPTVHRLFRSIDTTADAERVADALDQILRADTAVREVRWWTAAEVDRG